MASELDYQNPNGFQNEDGLMNGNTFQNAYDDRDFDEAKYVAAQRQFQIKQLTFFRNGDPFFAPKRYIFNERQVGTWDNLLQHVTDLVQPRSGYVERIYTPTMGHRVRSFDELHNGDAYVAAAKAERFHPLAYTRIRELPPIRTGALKKQRVFEGELGEWQSHNVVPTAPIVQHSTTTNGGSTFSMPKILHVFRNGDPFYNAQTVLLKPHEQRTWSAVLNAISDKVKQLSSSSSLKSTVCCDETSVEVDSLAADLKSHTVVLAGIKRQVRVYRLFRMDGSRVRLVEQLESGGSYVAAARERFSDVRYGRGLPRLQLGTMVRKEVPKFLSKPLTPGANPRAENKRGWHSEGDSLENDYYKRENTAAKKAIFDDNGFVGKPVRFTKLRSRTTTDVNEENSTLLESRSTPGQRQQRQEDSQPPQEFQEAQEPEPEPQETQESQEPQDPQDPQEPQEPQESQRQQTSSEKQQESLQEENTQDSTNYNNSYYQYNNGYELREADEEQ